MSTTLPRYFTTIKNVGETPLEALTRERIRRGIDESIPLAYAGRLDPMASGLLLILVGDECKVQEKYHAFDKTYIVELLLGTSSDTGDILGIITNNNTPVPPLTAKNITDALKECVGSVTLPYPHFSSRTVKGQPLHMWTLQNRIHEISIPEKTSTIYTLRYLGEEEVETTSLLTSVKNKIATLKTVTDPSKELGRDFRRKDILSSWEKLNETPYITHTILKFSVTVSSGTYMRSLVSLIAQKLGTTGLAYSITRVKIGKFVPISSRFGFYRKSF